MLSAWPEAERQLVHAVDEGQHDSQQGDDQREGQGGHQRGLPPHGEVAEVVAQRDFAQQQETSDQENGRGGGDRNLGSEGKHGFSLSASPSGRGSG